MDLLKADVRLDDVPQSGEADEEVRPRLRCHAATAGQHGRPALLGNKALLRSRGPAPGGTPNWPAYDRRAVEVARCPAGVARPHPHAPSAAAAPLQSHLLAPPCGAPARPHRRRHRHPPLLQTLSRILDRGHLAANKERPYPERGVGYEVSLGPDAACAARAPPPLSPRYRLYYCACQRPALFLGLPRRRKLAGHQAGQAAGCGSADGGRPREAKRRQWGSLRSRLLAPPAGGGPDRRLGPAQGRGVGGAAPWARGRHGRAPGGRCALGPSQHRKSASLLGLEPAAADCTLAAEGAAPRLPASLSEFARQAPDRQLRLRPGDLPQPAQ